MLVVAALVATVLGGCTGDLNTPGEPLRILGTDLAPAYIGQPYTQSVLAVGGLRPYDFTLVDGQLPPGITLQGGTLRGTPSKTGQYTFTLQVSDANLSNTVQRYQLTVATIPPPKLTLNVPSTQVDRRITLRAEVLDANGLTGLRSEVRWDAARFRLVLGSVRSSRQGLALFDDSADGKLEVALAPLGTTISGGAMLFQFDLEPVAGASYLKLDVATETMSAVGQHYAQTTEGRSPAAAAGTTPSSGTPPGTPLTPPLGGSTP